MGRSRSRGPRKRQRLLAHSPEELLKVAVAWQERAAIMEFDGGLAREDAEHLAREDVLGAGHGPDQGATKGVTQHWRPPKPDRERM